MEENTKQTGKEKRFTQLTQLRIEPDPNPNSIVGQISPGLLIPLRPYNFLECQQQTLAVHIVDQVISYAFISTPAYSPIRCHTLPYTAIRFRHIRPWVLAYSHTSVLRCSKSAMFALSVFVVLRQEKTEKNLPIIY